MREKARIRRICKLLEKVWSKEQNQRLGQLLINLIGTPDMFYIEDDEWEATLIDKCKEMGG